jgi:hypothetical protein
MRKTDGLVLCTNPTEVLTKPTSRAQRERDAKAYWDSLSPEQEAWALRKMGFFGFGQRAAPLHWPTRTPTA